MVPRVAGEKFPHQKFSIGGEKRQETTTRACKSPHLAVIRTQRGLSSGRRKKKVNKHFVMKINDTNHTQDLTHFSLFNCNGRDALIFN